MRMASTEERRAESSSSKGQWFRGCIPGLFLQITPYLGVLRLTFPHLFTVTCPPWPIARQHPRGEEETVFVTIEDESGELKCGLWPRVFALARHALRGPVLLVTGTVACWYGTTIGTEGNGWLRYGRQAAEAHHPRECASRRVVDLSRADRWDRYRLTPREQLTPAVYAPTLVKAHLCHGPQRRVCLVSFSCSTGLRTRVPLEQNCARETVKLRDLLRVLANLSEHHNPNRTRTSPTRSPD